MTGVSQKKLVEDLDLIAATVWSSRVGRPRDTERIHQAKKLIGAMTDREFDKLARRADVLVVRECRVDDEA